MVTFIENILKGVKQWIEELLEDRDYVIASHVNEQHTIIENKADKVIHATEGNFAGLDANGNIYDSGKKASDFATAAQGTKAATRSQAGLMSATDKLFVDSQINDINDENYLFIGWNASNQFNTAANISAVNTYVQSKLSLATAYDGAVEFPVPIVVDGNGDTSQVTMGIISIYNNDSLSCTIIVDGVVLVFTDSNDDNCIDTLDNTEYITRPWLANVPTIAAKQNVTDNSLNTTSKTIVGAINELEARIAALE